MSAISLVPEPLSEDHPSLNTPQPDYTAIRDGQVTERYQSAPMAMQRYALALDRLGRTEWGQRILGCCKSGSESAVCDRGKYADAHRHHCGDPFCAWDSSGCYRFNKWMGPRDPETFKQPHTAFDLRFDMNVDPSLTWADQQKKIMSVLGLIVWTAFDDGEMPHVAVDTFAERVSDAHIRVVFPGSMTYSQLRYRIEKAISKLHKKSCAKHWPAPIINVKRGDTIELFHWAFNGFKECAAMDPERKAELRIALTHHRSVAAWGACYKLVPKELRKDDEESVSCVCPVCKDHNLTLIPIEERHARPVEEIIAEYDHVNWGRNHKSPFAMRKGLLTDNVDPAYSEILEALTIATSPPPN